MTLNVSVIKLPPYSQNKTLSDKYGVGCGNTIYPTNLLLITTTSSPSLRCIVSVFGLLQKSHQNMLEKMDRPDQLIFQIGINGEVVELQIIENGLSWKGKDSP
ncbi:hypothetical protein K5B43_004018 [Vibrio parahaemolyticus]|nr:hypothetical protein [Vibrio parahaemolyticus]